MTPTRQIVLLAFIGCGKAESRAPAPAAPPITAAQAADAGTGLDTSSFAPNMPGGWRDLRWGMSEKQVSAIMKREKWAPGSDRWKRSEGQEGLTVLAPSGRFFVVAPEARFRCWFSCGLEGANCVQAWFLDGKLVEVIAQAAHDLERGAFRRRATESYGAEPRTFQISFVRPRSDRLADAPDITYDVASPREVLYWSGPATAAILYESLGQARQQVVAWSSEAMPHIWAALLKKEAGDQAAADRDRKELEEATRF